MPDLSTRNIPFVLHPLGMLDVFIAMGFCLTDLLRGTGVDAQYIGEKHLRISYLQLSRIISNAIALSPEPGLGLKVGSALDWQAHGSVGGVIYSSPSLIDAHLAFSRYLQIAQPIYKLFFPLPDYYFDRDHYVVNRLDPLNDPRLLPTVTRFEVEFRLAVLVRLCHACGNHSAEDNRIEIGIGYAAQEYSELFYRLPVAQVKSQCSFSYIAVHRDFFLNPWRSLRRALYENLVDQCEEELVAQNTLSVSEQLTWLIHKNHFSELRLQDAAEQLSLSPRALARRLAIENNSFRNIQNQIRAGRANCHLKYSRLPQEDIASLLGFSCAASMRRAAKAMNVKHSEIY